MIEITRLDGKDIVLNADWIQSIEKTPDTLITLTSGVQLIVRNSVDEIIQKYRAHKKEAFRFSEETTK